MKLWGRVTIGTKGQVVIPAEARAELNLKEGEKLVVLSAPMEDGILLVKADSVEAMMQHVLQDLMQIQDSAHKPGKKLHDNIEVVSNPQQG